MSTQVWQRPFGAVPLPEGGTEFRVWAPSAARVDVRLHGRDHALAPLEGGVFAGEAFADPGDDYLFVLDGGDALPDPCSRSQPDGHPGPVARRRHVRVRDRAQAASSTLDELVLYELHVGTFTAGGDVRRRDPAPRPRCASSASPRSS